jgi:aldose 1-epimerase
MNSDPAPDPAAPAGAGAAARVRLEAGDLVAEVAPAIGGALAAFYSAPRADAPRRDWLRPATPAALEHGTAFDMASFPLVPWCNRIRDGRFPWNGREVRLAPNRPPSPHPIHGIGWERRWSVAARGPAWVELTLGETGLGGWPFPFQAVQRYALEPDGLTIRLSLRNTGAEAMPAGIGHHPYLPHRREGDGTRVQADVAAIWLSDADLLPTALSTTHPAVEALRRGMDLRRFDLDNNFVGFGHEARVEWPDGADLRLVGPAPLDCFVLYCPAAKDVFVIEAVSNCTDWPNLRDRFGAAQTGGATLAPGAMLEAVTRFLPTRP